MLSDRTKKLLERIDEAKKLIDKYRPLPNSILHRLREQLVVEWTYNSNAIEGNTLTLKETRLVLEDGITIGGRSLKEHLEVTNHKEAIEFVEALAKKDQSISEFNLKEIHALILKEIDAKYAGRYRDVQVRITGSTHTPPAAIHLPQLMKKFSKEYLSASKEHPVVRAALAHFKLVDIHPFIDGNGRTARLLMNLILIGNGYLPAVVLKVDRKKYYDALEKAHSGKVDDFIFLVGRAIERTLYLYMEAVPKIKTHFISLKEASEISPYSFDYLNVLARRGAIPAFKFKRNWVVTKEALERYINEHK